MPRFLRALCVVLLVPGTSPAQQHVGAREQPTLSSAIADFQARRHADAEAAFQELHGRSPRDATIMMYLGRLALLRGDDEAAARWLERALREDGDVAEYHHWLGRAWAQRALHAGLWQRARLALRIRSVFERAVELDPADLAARLDLLRFHVTAPGIVGGSLRAARAQAAAIDELDSMWGSVSRGLIAEREGDESAAEREYRSALASHPGRAAPYYALGALHQRSGRFLDAFEVYARLREAMPEETNVLYQIGRTASISGHSLDDGARALIRYLEIPTVEGTPLPASAHYRLGLIYERLGHTDRARRELQRAAALEPERDDVKEALGRIR